MKSAKWYAAVSKPRPKHVREAISRAQRMRKHQPHEGFQKGHAVFSGTERTRFKKGQIYSVPIERVFRKHGLSSSKFYRAWISMNTRCSNPKFKHYKNYGGRGIKVEWNSFEEFRDDMYKQYLTQVSKYGKENISIDRIDNDRNYSKENCRWTTKAVQMRNRRNNHMLTFNGKTQCMTDWAREIGISYPVLWKRLKKMSLSEALTGYEI